jgi:hypothetical protein
MRSNRFHELKRSAAKRISVLLSLIALISLIYPAVNALPQWCKAGILDQCGDRGIDADEDGLYEFLAMDVGIKVEAPGEYSLMGYLYDSLDNEIVWSIDHRNLSAGNQTMQLDFDGKEIRKNGVDGPYYIHDLTLVNGSSYTGLIVCERLQRACNTSAYNSSDFKGLRERPVGVI